MLAVGPVPVLCLFLAFLDHCVSDVSLSHTVELGLAFEPVHKWSLFTRTCTAVWSHSVPPILLQGLQVMSCWLFPCVLCPFCFGLVLGKVCLHPSALSLREDSVQCVQVVSLKKKIEVSQNERLNL